MQWRGRWRGKLSLNGLVALFVCTVLVPGLLLAVFGWRALRQERFVAQQQLRDRLNEYADLAVRNLDQEFRVWQQWVEQLRPEKPLPLPPALAGHSTFVYVDGGALRAIPPEALLYQPLTAAPVAERVPAAFLQIEQGELRGQDPSKALAEYQALLRGADAGRRLWLWQRIARLHRRLNQREAALAAYREMDRAVPQGSFVARYEICALLAEAGPAAEGERCSLDLYRALLEPRWQLDKAQYLFYSDELRQRGGNSSELEQLAASEQRKLAVMSAVETLLARPERLVAAGDRPWLAWWRDEPFAALLVEEASLRQHFWPALVQPAETVGIRLKLVAANSSGATGALLARRSLQSLGLPWSLEAVPLDPEQLRAGMARRERFYFAMLLLLVAVLVFGAYVTARAVRREMEVARLKAEFVSAVSHEFRSPLTGIRQLAEILSRGGAAGDERKQQYYRMILQESARLSRLVENVLDFSRIEDGRKQYRVERVDTSEWLATVAAEFQSEVEARGFTVQAAIPAALPGLLGDREALSCAVRNLLDNAVKYSPECRTVWLEAEASERDIQIRVRDRGIGIPEQERKRVFEKFIRGTSQAARQINGVGLGLSLVQQIVMAHGGTVVCSGAAEGGTVFTVDLPASASAGASLVRSYVTSPGG